MSTSLVSCINRIRLEFKDRALEGAGGTKMNSINRSRLEFKDPCPGFQPFLTVVLIESDWNLKLRHQH